MSEGGAPEPREPEVGAEPLAEQIRVAAHLEHAGELVRGQRWAEAEIELLRALAAGAADLRALKLLALVRFKLGRFNEARDTFQVIARAVPDDAGVHFNLGLVALKLDWFDEAVAELEVAARLSSGDQRTWSYLGYAYARTGRTALAVEAFERAGQHDLAREAASGTAEPPASLVEPVPEPPPREPPGADDASGLFAPSRSQAADAVEVVEGFAPPDEPSEKSEDPGTLTGFVLGRLVPLEVAPDVAVALPAGLVRVPVEGEVYFQSEALIATSGPLAVSAAGRRTRGRFEEQPLASMSGPFMRGTGAGELLLSPRDGEELRVLTLEDDILYVRTDRVAAFDASLAWEAGALPREGVELLQFRGTGRVVLRLPEAGVMALKLPTEGALRVLRGRLLGWVGRVVVQGGTELVGRAIAACEGEGVVLLLRHGEPGQHVEQRS